MPSWSYYVSFQVSCNANVRGRDGAAETRTGLSCTWFHLMSYMQLCSFVLGRRDELARIVADELVSLFAACTKRL